MHFFGEVTSSAGRFFQICFDDIRVQLDADIRPVLTGGFLRAVRNLVPTFAILLASIFFAHSARPAVANRVSATLRTMGIGVGNIEQKVPFYQTGIASWYGSEGDGFLGRTTANMEIMDAEAYTCAHKTLPFGTIVEVVNLDNNKSILLRVNDRGPYINGRIIDVSWRGASEIGLLRHGVAPVSIRPIKNILQSYVIDTENKLFTKSATHTSELSDFQEISEYANIPEAIERLVAKDLYASHVFIRPRNNAPASPGSKHSDVIIPSPRYRRAGGYSLARFDSPIA